ncbi:MAG TPA: S41 family peptidase [Candidatus Paceibacterota bacterium]
MNKESQKATVRLIVGLLFVFIIFFLGRYSGQRESILFTNNIKIPDDVSITDKQFEPFWKVWNILNQKYVAATTTDTEARIWGAIQGLASSQGDPYTVFFPPDESKMFKSDISGNFEGVGMEIGIKDNILTVVAPLKDSPAERSGLHAGDKIIMIDDTNTADMPADKAVKLIRGPKGSKVKITVIREGSTQPLEKTIIRDIIDIPTIQTEVKNSDGTTSVDKVSGLRSDGVFIIRLFSFTAQSPDLFRSALRQFIESGSNKLIIDLRGNPGGYLDAAWDMASWFLPVGKVIVTEDFGGKKPDIVYRSKGYDVFSKNLKLVVLVDAGSASASEILAGALREHGIATLIGTKTFGKGSVQELIEITGNTSLKVTVARWLTPEGHNLSNEGLSPDIEVKITQKEIDDKKDPAMDKAVEFLKK